MTWSITDVIPPWGDSGERWSDNFEYQGQDQVNEKHLNYFIDSVGTLEDDVRSSLQDIDSDQDGVVDDSDRYDGLAPSDGSNGQVLQTDGSTTQWGTAVSTNIQTTEPAYSEGDFWMNPDTGALHVGYNGSNGEDYYSVPPIQTTEEMTIFDGTEDGSFTTSGGLWNSPSGRLTISPLESFEDGDTSEWDDPDISAVQQTQTDGADPYEGNYCGYHPKTSSSNISASRSIDGGASTDSLYIAMRLEGGGNATDSNDDVQAKYTNESGSDFLSVVFEGSSGDLEINGTTVSSFNASTWHVIGFEQIDWSSNNVGSVTQDGTEIASNVSFLAEASSVGGAAVEATGPSSGFELYVDWFGTTDPSQSSGSGMATVSWPYPNLEAWDLTTYRGDPSGGSITVDVLDGNDNVLFSDINRNFDISTVDSSKNIKLRITLSRSSLSDEPYVDYVARRYIR